MVHELRHNIADFTLEITCADNFKIGFKDISFKLKLGK